MLGRDAGGQLRQQLVVALHPRDREHGSEKDDHFRKLVEDFAALGGVVFADMGQEGAQALVELSEVAEIHEKVNDDVQAEQADEANDVVFDIAADHQSVENQRHLQRLVKLRAAGFIPAGTSPAARHCYFS
jgi:hypothetical protein